MFIPGLICIAGGLMLINRLRDTPQSLGLPSIEKFRDDYPAEVKQEASDTPLSPKQILTEYILPNPYIWILALSYCCVYIVRQGMTDWTALYLIEEKGYSTIYANGSVSMFDIGGMLGALAAGWSSDRLFNAKRGPVNVLYALGILATVCGFWYFKPESPLFDSISIFLIGFMVFGPQMMIGMQAVELCPKNAAATATGFVGTFAYLGATVAGYPVGLVTQYYGWDGFFIFIAASASLSLLLLLPLWSVTRKSALNEKTAKA
jgi:OPA family sugar phosphate sensor protein UhpC-like MFS transporter